MCHHKAPHREWEPHPKYRELFQSDIKVPNTFDDYYKNHAKATRLLNLNCYYLNFQHQYPDLGCLGNFNLN